MRRVWTLTLTVRSTLFIASALLATTMLGAPHAAVAQQDNELEAAEEQYRLGQLREADVQLQAFTADVSNRQRSAELARAFAVWSNVAEELGQADKALERASVSYRLYAALRDASVSAPESRTAAIRMSQLYRDRDAVDEARSWVLRALAVPGSQRENNPIWQARALDLLASIEADAGDADAAAAAWQAVVQQTRSVLAAVEDDSASLEVRLEAFDLLARASAALNETESARDALDSGLAIPVDSDDYPRRIATLLSMARTYEKLTDLPGAFACLDAGKASLATVEESELEAAVLARLENDLHWRRATLTDVFEATDIAPQAWDACLEHCTSMLKVTEDARLRATCLGRMTTSAMRLGKHDVVIEQGKELIALLQETSASTDPRIAPARLAIGLASLEVGDPRTAEAAFTEVLECWETVDPSTPYDYFSAVIGLSQAKSKVATPSEAMQVLEHYEARCRELLPEQDPRRADLHCHIGSLRSALGLFDAAIRRYETAIGIYEANAQQSDGESRSEVYAATLLNLALIYKSQSSNEAATRYAQQALDLQLAADPLRPLVLSCHILLADLHLAIATAGGATARAELESARDHLKSARDVALQLDQVSDKTRANLATLEGDVFMYARQADQAVSHWREALTFAERAEEAVLATQLMNRLARLEAERGNLSVAVDLLDRALDKVDALDAFPNLHYVTLVNRAGVLLSQLRTANPDRRRRSTVLQEINDHLLEAIQIIERPRLSVRGGQVARAEYFKRLTAAHSMLFQLRLSAFAESKARQPLLEAIFYADSSRNRTFVDSVASIAWTDSEALDERQLALLEQKNELLREQKKLEGLLRYAAGGDSEEATSDSARPQELQARQELGDVRERLSANQQAFRRSIEASSSGIATLLVSTDPERGLDQLRALFAGGQCLVFYHVGSKRSHVFAIDEEQITHRPLRILPGRAAALGVEAGHLTQAKLAVLVARYLSLLKDSQSAQDLLKATQASSEATSSGESSSLQVKEFAVALGDVVFPPEIRRHVADATPPRVIVIPDGPLHRLPLEALVVADQSTAHFLIDELPPVAYGPSAIVLATLTERAAREPRTTNSLLTVGGPVHEGYAPLPSAQDESNRIVKLFTDLADQDDISQFLGRGATEAAIREALSERAFAFVHVAAHGQVDEKAKAINGHLVLTPNAAGGQSDDGKLTLEEVMQLPLRNCQLAALSACQTNVGKDVPLESGMTLARSFFAAGALRVVASQWEVADRSTAELMAEFFADVARQQESSAGVDYAAALNAARNHVRATWPSPYYWAPMILIGPAK